MKQERNIEVPGETHTRAIFLPQIPHRLSRDRTQAFAVRLIGKTQLTAKAINAVKSYLHSSSHLIFHSPSL
jgi:hypothetical protein